MQQENGTICHGQRYEQELLVDFLGEMLLQCQSCYCQHSFYLNPLEAKMKQLKLPFNLPKLLLSILYLRCEEVVRK